MVKHDPQYEGLHNVLNRTVIKTINRRNNKVNHIKALQSFYLQIESELRAVYEAKYLSPAEKKLYAETWNFAKDHVNKYIWVKYELVYIHK